MLNATPATEPGRMDPQRMEQLLMTARRLAGRLDLGALVPELRTALGALPGVTYGGLGIYEDDRDTLTTELFAVGSGGDADPRRIEIEALPDAPPALLRNGDGVFLSEPLDPEPQEPLERALRAAGVQRYLGAPLQLGERRLGTLLVGLRADADVADEVRAFVQHLAALLTPVVWNCHTHERFRLGDKRRDTLVELSDAINTSLRMEAVLASGWAALRRLGGHAGGALQLLSADGQACVVYRSLLPPEQQLEALPTPVTVPLAGTVMQWICQQECTYISDDLTRKLRFEHDAELRQCGVRRYVAAPMFVRGRITGCFLVTAADPKRPLQVDVWLFENIALQLALAIDNARQLEEVQRLTEQLKQQNVYLREQIKREELFDEMVGQAAPLRRVREAIVRVSGTDATVLILGETGVGKELVARAIRAASGRASQPLVKVNCAAIPETMVESELFGHERGAFTSAIERRIGRFELARDGTLFLDEVGELPLAVQAKLLRVLQDGEFERVGGTKTLTSNARIIAATNRNLAEAVAAGTFRRDLYYRLNVFPIEVPPLRERRDDIPLLATAFIQQFNRQMGKHVTRLDDAALANLMSRDWPGNVRELRHVIERAMILCDGPTLRLEDGPRPPVQPQRVTPPVSPPAGAPRGGDVLTLAQAEAEHIRHVLEQTRWVIEGPRGAAKLLGVKPSTLRYRMRRLGVRRPA